VLLLLTIALVLVGAVSLVIGFVGGEQLPIFISIACSLLAGVVLVVFSRMSRRQGAPATAGGPAPLADQGAPATSRQAAVSDAEVEEAVSEPEPASGGRAFAADEFPIEDYDELLVSEILPLLAELDADELEQVREREESGKARATLLRRVEQLAEGEDEPTVATPAFAARGSAAADEADDDGDDELMFPIEDYDDLRVSEILPLLPELYDDELELVADHERDGANRASVLNRIEELLGGGAPAPAPKKAAPKKAAPKKAAPRKAAPKKAAPKKAAVRRAAPAKKAVAKKATTARKAPAATRTVKKAATTKKTAAKKSSARKR
jgi:hypothetical protein